MTDNNDYVKITAGTPPNPKRRLKDSVFRDLLSRPEYLLQLYQTLHPEDIEASGTDLADVTIENILMNGVYNDLGFTVRRRRLILAEAQSTWSENIAVRILIYLAETWSREIKQKRQNVYGEEKVQISVPEFYVIYTGRKEDRPEWISLSEAFLGGDGSNLTSDAASTEAAPRREFAKANSLMRSANWCGSANSKMDDRPSGLSSNLELRVRVLSGGGENIIDQYIEFCREFDRQVGIHKRTRRAIRETIRICKEKDILRRYLEENEQEVTDRMSILFDQEYVTEVYGWEQRQQGRTEGHAAGRTEGMEEGRAAGRAMEKKEIAVRLYEGGHQLSEIAGIVLESEETIRRWLQEEPAPC